MKSLLLGLLVLASFQVSFGQTPQLAVVKPNGVTTIHSSWTAAYAAAANDDFVYLPGAVILGNITIDKRIHIFGTGIHPDSSAASGRTILSSPVTIMDGGSGGSLEGVQVSSAFTIGENNKVTNFTLRRCLLGSLIFFTYHADSVPEFCTITESIITTVYSTLNNGAISKNIYLSKNIITSQVHGINLSTFSNNIFTINGNSIWANVTNSIFQNNIFLNGNPIASNNNNCNNSYYHNLSLLPGNYSANCQNYNIEGNIIVSNVDSIFQNYVINGFFTSDYHLLPTCPGVGAGTDATDVGIYGTINPTSEAWIPANPHIYYKSINAETGPDGKLHIQVGVRTNTD